MSNVQLRPKHVRGLRARRPQRRPGNLKAKVDWREAESRLLQHDGATSFGTGAIVQNLFMKLATDWVGLAVTPIAFHDAGDSVVTECRYTTFRSAKSPTSSSTPTQLVGWGPKAPATVW